MTLKGLGVRGYFIWGIAIDNRSLFYLLSSL
jgi:hypothetical protein